MNGPEHFAAIAHRALPGLKETTMNHYAAGTRFEHKTRDNLTDNGYEVIRAAGSKGSSKVDLVAVKPGQWLFIQCKATGALGPSEWDRILEVAGWVGAVPLLAANGPRGRGITYIRLLGPKRRSVPMKNQPCEVFHLDHIAAASPPSASGRPEHPQPKGHGYPRSSDALPGAPSSDTWNAVGGL